MTARQPRNGRLRVCVVSDLHIFCRRSCWERYEELLHAAIARADLCVLNGDIFDFKWVHRGTQAGAVAEAGDFLRALAGRHPHCRFHLVLGNHDHFEAFIALLDQLAADLPHFAWDPHHLRLGDTLFLHGDVVTAGRTRAHFDRFRARWLRKPSPGRAVNTVYDAVFALGGQHAAARLAYPHARTLRRLHAYLDAAELGAAAGVRRVCFGHTHRVLHGRRHGGIVYHNSGAALRGVPFQILEMEVETAE